MKALSLVRMTTYLLLVSVLSSCASNSKPDPIQKNMSELKTDIQAIIGSANCTSTIQCQSIGFGDKPCGGFSTYLIYSNQRIDVDKLKNRVDQYNKLSETWNRENNISSTCEMLMPPLLTCHQQTCQSKEIT